MLTNTQENHQNYTFVEWNDNEYFKNVVNYLKEKNIKTAMDVGGCTGEVSSILFEKISSLEKIVILEPIKENYDFIVSRLNGDGCVDVINKALFYGEEYITLGRIDENVGGWSIGKNGSHRNHSKIDKIKTITLEELSDVDFIKIDIEGAEINVIENSKKIHDTPYIEIEFHFDLCEESNWQPYIKKYLTNHKVIFSKNQNVFLEKNKK